MLSVVDRFLEHARIFYFEAGGKREVYLSSADWMPRNFVRRVEVMFPVEDAGLRDRLVNEILSLMLSDNVKARRLLPDGSYERLKPPAPAEAARRSAASSGSWSWPGRRGRRQRAAAPAGRRASSADRPPAAAPTGRRPAADLAS